MGNSEPTGGRDEDRISQAVVRSLAECEDVDPVDLRPPLYDAINPEALDALFAPVEEGTRRHGGRVDFTYQNYTITVGSDGTVTVDERDADGT